MRATTVRLFLVLHNKKNFHYKCYVLFHYLFSRHCFLSIFLAKHDGLRRVYRCDFKIANVTTCLITLPHQTYENACRKIFRIFVMMYVYTTARWVCFFSQHHFTISIYFPQKNFFLSTFKCFFSLPRPLSLHLETWIIPRNCYVCIKFYQILSSDCIAGALCVFLAVFYTVLEFIFSISALKTYTFCLCFISRKMVTVRNYIFHYQC